MHARALSRYCTMKAPNSRVYSPNSNPLLNNIGGLESKMRFWGMLNTTTQGNFLMGKSSSAQKKTLAPVSLRRSAGLGISVYLLDNCGDHF